MNKIIRIADRLIGEGQPTFIIAEMSANHLQDFNRAKKIIEVAAEAGADAIKLQTYTPDTITLDCDNKYFQVTQGTIWDGTTLHKLYEKAYTPWDWQPKLMEYAKEQGIICFSSPFDYTSVDFLEQLNVPAYKIASFEALDLPFLEYIANKGKPVIISTGIAYETEIKQALNMLTGTGNEDIVLLKCTSAYPANYEELNLATIADMKDRFKCIVGYSDHSMGSISAVVAVSQGAKVIEKHLTLSRADGGADGAFSMEPQEFKDMVKQIRIAEQAMGTSTYELTPRQIKSREHGRSLFVVKDIEAGESLTKENIKSIRPAFGLDTSYYPKVLGKCAKCRLEKGTPLRLEDLN